MNSPFTLVKDIEVNVELDNFNVASGIALPLSSTNLPLTVYLVTAGGTSLEGLSSELELLLDSLEGGITTVESSLENLEKVYPVIEAIDEANWNIDYLHEKVFELIKSLEIKNGTMLWPIRTALSGKPSTPGGAFEIAILIGKEETLKRLQKGIELLKA